MLLEESKERGAAWTTVKPKNNWVSSWVILRLNINIMERLSFSDIKISRVRIC